VASKAVLLLSAILFIEELGTTMLCKTSTLAHKTTLTQTHTTPVGEIILISPIETTTPFLLMPPQPQPSCFQHKAPYNPPHQQQPSHPNSNLESLMEQFIATQTKTNDALSASINQLNSKFKAMTTHQKMMENRIVQIVQQVSHLSRPQGHLLGQPKTNPKGHMNAITLRSGKELESP